MREKDKKKMASALEVIARILFISAVVSIGLLCNYLLVLLGKSLFS